MEYLYTEHPHKTILSEKGIKKYKKCKRKVTYLKQEISQSQEWWGIPKKTQTEIDNKATTTITLQVFETFWCPRCKKEKNLGKTPLK